MTLRLDIDPCLASTQSVANSKIEKKYYEMYFLAIVGPNFTDILEMLFHIFKMFFKQ